MRHVILLYSILVTSTAGCAARSTVPAGVPVQSVTAAADDPIPAVRRVSSEGGEAPIVGYGEAPTLTAAIMRAEVHAWVRTMQSLQVLVGVSSLSGIRLGEDSLTVIREETIELASRLCLALRPEREEFDLAQNGMWHARVWLSVRSARLPDGPTGTRCGNLLPPERR